MKNSGVKIRSHQQLVTPPEGGSFRQLTRNVIEFAKRGNLEQKNHFSVSYVQPITAEGSKIGITNV